MPEPGTMINGSNVHFWKHGRFYWFQWTPFSNGRITRQLDCEDISRDVQEVYDLKEVKLLKPNKLDHALSDLSMMLTLKTYKYERAIETNINGKTRLSVTYFPNVGRLLLYLSKPSLFKSGSRNYGLEQRLYWSRSLAKSLFRALWTALLGDEAV